MVSGQITRVRFCVGYPPDSLEIHIPHLLRPVWCLWPAIRARAAPGRRLLSALNGKEVFSELRAVT